MKSNNFHYCNCEYCDYIDLQKSMTSLPISSISTGNVDRGQGNGTAKHGDATKVSLKSPEMISFESSPLYSQWFRLLIGLRLVGSLPLSHKLESHHRRPHVLFRWISWASFYTLVMHAFRIVVYIWYYKDWGYFMLGRKYEDTLLDWIIRFLNYSVPINLTWDILMVWATSKRGAKLCNSWIDFHFLFENTFSENCSEKRNRAIRKWNCIKFILVTAFVVGVPSGVFGEVFLGQAAKRDLSTLLRIPPIMLFLVIMILEDVRVLLLYYTPAESFTRIRQAIKQELRDNVTIPTHVVTSWTKVILAVRTHVTQTGHVQAPVLIPLFLHTIIIFTGLLFFGIKSLLFGKGSKHLVTISIFGISFMGRLILKTIVADLILSAEEAVVDLLLAVDSERFDINGKLEISKIIDTLQQKPSKISLSGYITIDKKLIAKIMGQIVEYLVVLIQFDLGYYGKKATFNNNCPNQTISS